MNKKKRILINGFVLIIFSILLIAINLSLVSAVNPIGFLDSVNASSISGWACDTDTPSQSIIVHVYFNGPSSSGYGVNIGSANLPSEPAVTSACGGGTSHRFYYNIPQNVLNAIGSGAHSVYAYGINTGIGSNTLLSQSPKYFITGASYVFADITDTHIPQYGLDNIRFIVQKINQHNPDKTIITGDISQDSPYYSAAKAELDNLIAGYYPVPGNHDITHTYSSSPNDPTSAFRNAFGLSSTNYVVSIDNEYQAVFLSCTKDYIQFPTDTADCSDAELTMLQNALNNGKQTFVFVHYPVLQVSGHETPLYHTENLNSLKRILNVPNLVAVVVGHDGCEKGIYTVENKIRQYMGPHLMCKGWCGSCTSSNPTPSEAIPTISYFNLFSNKVIITQECATSGCIDPHPIEISLSVASCNSFTYSDWSECSSSGIQTRTETSRTPSGCVGTPILSQQCTYVPPVVPTDGFINGFNSQTGIVREGGVVPLNYSGSIECENNNYCSFKMQVTTSSGNIIEPWITLYDRSEVKTNISSSIGVTPIVGSALSLYTIHYALSSEDWGIWRNVSTPCKNCTFFPGDYDGDGVSDILGYSNEEKQGYFVLSSDWSTWHNFDIPACSESSSTCNLIPITGSYDGDNKSDLVAYDSSGMIYYLLSSEGYGNWHSLNTPCQNCKFISGDYNVDGVNDLIGYAPKACQPPNCEEDCTLASALMGGVGPGWTPLAGDFDGDNISDLTVYKTGIWSALLSGDGYSQAGFIMGGVGYDPYTADLDGDGKTDMLVYNKSTGDVKYAISPNWIINSANIGSGWTLVLADYDGDKKADIMGYNEASGNWVYYLTAENYSTVHTFNWGGPGWKPVQVNYDKHRNGDLFLYNSQSNTFKAFIKSNTGYSSELGYTPEYGLGPLFQSVASSGSFTNTELLKTFVGDYDGDGYSDLGVYADSPNGVYVMFAMSGEEYSPRGFSEINLGGPGGTIVSGNLDNNTRDDLILYKDGTWYGQICGGGAADNSSLKTVLYYALSPFTTGWNYAPMSLCINCTFFPGDYNGDGTSDFLGYSNVEKKMYYNLAPFGGWNSFNISFCSEGESCNILPISGKFNDDSQTDIVTYNPSTGSIFYALSSSNGGGYPADYSGELDTPCKNCTVIPGDYDNDGFSDLMLYSVTTISTLDTAAPTISFISPTETSGVTLSRTNIQVNVNASDDTALSNLTVRLYDSARAQINSTTAGITFPYFINFTSLSNGTYYFNATACDTSNNCANTETRNVTINTTIITDTTPPTISFISPTETSGVTLSRTNIQVNVNASDETALSNLTARLYNSARVQIHLTISATSPLFINFTSLNNGTYYFNATACDTSNNCASTETINVTINTTIITDTTPPTISFISPTETSGVTLSRTNIQVNVTVSDDADLSNVTIRLYNSTRAQINSKEGILATLFSNFMGLDNGTYYFNATACDTSNNCASTETINVTINTSYIDTTPPTISFISPTETSGVTLSRTNIQVNVNASDNNIVLSSITIRLYNSTRVQINSTTSTTSPLFINFTSLSNGTYYFNATACDTSNNCANTETRTVTINTSFTDTINPTISFISPTENSSTINRTNIQVNVNASDNNIVLSSITIRLYNSTRVQINSTTSTTSPLFVNFINLDDGTYYFNATACDSVGNCNNTETINVTINTSYIDTTAPTIAFISPTDDSSTLNRTFIRVYVIAEDAHLKNITLYLYNSTGLNMILVETSASHISTELSGLKNGTYYFNATARDTSNNYANTVTKKVIINTSFIDTTAPTIALIEPENNKNKTSSETYFGYNVSDLSNIASCTLLIQNSNGSSKSYTSNWVIKFIEQSFTEDIDVGSYTWNVTCVDSFGKRGTSATWNIIRTTGLCGNDVCDDDIETCSNCPHDCNSCNNVSGYCGDEECNNEETSRSCARDCGSIGGGGFPLYTIYAYDLQRGYTRWVIVDSVFRFKIGANSEWYTVKLLSLTTSSATIVAQGQGASQMETLNIGEEKKFELTGDNYYDISVKLNSIKSKRASMTIKVTTGMVPPPNVTIIPCTPRWECDWSECIEGKQDKQCADKNNCGKQDGRPAAQERDCNSGWTQEQYTIFLGFLIGFIIILAVLIFFVWWFFKTDTKYVDKYQSAKIFVSNARKRGYKDSEIRKMFVQKGWKNSDIDKVL